VSSTGVLRGRRSNPRTAQGAKGWPPSQIGGQRWADDVECGAIHAKPRTPSVEHGVIRDRCTRKARGPATRDATTAAQAFYEEMLSEVVIPRAGGLPDSFASGIQSATLSTVSSTQVSSCLTTAGNIQNCGCAIFQLSTAAASVAGSGSKCSPYQLSFVNTWTNATNLPDISATGTNWLGNGVGPSDTTGSWSSSSDAQFSAAVAGKLIDGARPTSLMVEVENMTPAIYAGGRLIAVIVPAGENPLAGGALATDNLAVSSAFFSDLASYPGSVQIQLASLVDNTARFSLALTSSDTYQLGFKIPVLDAASASGNASDGTATGVAYNPCLGSALVIGWISPYSATANQPQLLSFRTTRKYQVEPSRVGEAYLPASQLPDALNIVHQIGYELAKSVPGGLANPMCMMQLSPDPMVRSVNLGHAQGGNARRARQHTPRSHAGPRPQNAAEAAVERVVALEEEKKAPIRESESLQTLARAADESVSKGGAESGGFFDTISNIVTGTASAAEVLDAVGTVAEVLLAV
jgi:hypothetical protein